MIAFLHETLTTDFSAAPPRVGSTLHLSTTPTGTNTAAAQPASKFSTPRQAPKKESRERATHPASINVNHSARGHRLCCYRSFQSSVLTLVHTPHLAQGVVVERLPCPLPSLLHPRAAPGAPSQSLLWPPTLPWGPTPRHFALRLCWPLQLAGSRGLNFQRLYFP